LDELGYGIFLPLELLAQDKFKGKVKCKFQKKFKGKDKFKFKCKG